MLYTGLTGYIKTGITPSQVTIAHMSSWEVELSAEIIEVVSFGNSYKEKVPSIKDWSATVDGAADFATLSGQKALVDAFEAGTLLTFGFGLTATDFMVGTGYIESLTITDEADGNVTISMSVAGSNAVILADNITAWLTATAYVVGQFVSNGGSTYKCLVSHTSATFATDLSANKWIKVV